MSPREQLNSREIRVATLVWQGRTNPEIAVTLSTSEQLVKNQLRSGFDKLGSGAGWSSSSTWLRMAAPGGLKILILASTWRQQPRSR